MHDALALLLVAAAGVLAGIANVTAGGGSLLTVPVLILLGLPGPVANGTNRLALVVQNVTGVAQFRHGGISELRRGGKLALAGLPGAIAGAIVGVRIDDQLFRRILGAALLVMLVAVLTRRSRRAGTTEAGRQGLRPVSWLAFVALGFYAGFLQAGIGFLILFVLVGLEGMDLVRANALKITFILLLQVVALAIFAAGDSVRWLPGLALAAGNATGASIAVRLSLARGERFIRPVLAAAVVAFAAKLLFF